MFRFHLLITVFCAFFYQVSYASGFSSKVEAVAYLAQQEDLSKIYGKVWLGIRGEVEQKVWRLEDVFVWGNVDYLDVSGKSIGEMKFPTEMRLIPIGFGLKLKRSLGSYANFTFGSGPKYSIVDISNHTDDFTMNYKKGAWGTVVNGGLDLALTENISFDLTYGYFHTKFVNHQYEGTISSNDLIISSINIASGLQINF